MTVLAALLSLTGVVAFGAEGQLVDAESQPGLLDSRFNATT